MGNSIEEGFLKTVNDIRGAKGKITNPYIEGSQKVVKLKPFKTELENIKLKKLNLVSISLPYIAKKDIVYKENGKGYPLNHKIVQYKKDYKKELLEQFKKSILYAVEEYNANVICINELGMPTNNGGTGHNTAIRFAKKIANEYKCLIVAGSNHSTNGFFNVGYIFYPGLNEKDEPYKHYLKNIGAFQIGEKLFTPSDRIIPYTKAFGLGFSFMICLELADFSSSSTIVHSKENTDLLLVPTYLSTWGPMEKVAKKLSEACGGVLLNNCYQHYDLPSSRLYLNGDLPSMSGDDLEHREDHTIDKVTKIVLRKINLKKFIKKKTEKTSNLSDELCFLFGVENLRRSKIS